MRHEGMIATNGYMRVEGHIPQGHMVVTVASTSNTTEIISGNTIAYAAREEWPEETAKERRIREAAERARYAFARPPKHQGRGCKPAKWGPRKPPKQQRRDRRRGNR